MWGERGGGGGRGRGEGEGGGGGGGGRGRKEGGGGSFLVRGVGDTLYPSHSHPTFHLSQSLCP